MDRILPGIIVALVLIGLLALMWRGWRRRSARDADVPAGHPLPTELSPELARADVYYVATTPRDVPLERLAVRGLAFRAHGELLVTGEGLVLNLDGEEAFFVPAGAIDALTDATWTIDRAVEPGGLVLLGWMLPGDDHRQVDSYFRITDPAGRERIVTAITSIAPQSITPSSNAPTPTGQDASTESEV
ncbi:hypothetical protein [Glaciibacter superstes]|uniref:PH-like domain-containing protein n=1 Tax=Glaciibacter superstes TaxID=501023 RepID=UPI0003B4B831|nr:hypothetical protein [Glaciibacter superstes]